jgi:hypothetical protein
MDYMLTRGSGVLRNELVGEALRAYQRNSYVHHRETSREPRIKL